MRLDTAAGVTSGTVLFLERGTLIMHDEPIDNDEVVHLAKQLSGAGWLTVQQAKAYILCDCVGLDQNEAADVMDIAQSTVSDHLAGARVKIEKSKTTVSTTNAIQMIVEDSEATFDPQPPSDQQ